MAQNGDTASSSEPEHGANWAGKYCQWDGNDGESAIELSGGGVNWANVKVLATKLADSPHSTHYENNDKQKCQVREQTVDEEHEEDDGIVAGEVAEIVGGSVLGFTEAGRLGEEGEIEEFSKRLQVGEACRD